VEAEIERTKEELERSKERERALEPDLERTKEELERSKERERAAAAELKRERAATAELRRTQVLDMLAKAKPCLVLQEALNKQLQPEIHHKMLPASRTIALRQTSRTMRTAVEKADVVVQARRGIQFPGGQGLLDKLIGLSTWCKVTVLRLEECSLGEGGGRALAETLRLNTTLTSLELRRNRLGEGAGRALAETLRLNTTVTSLDLRGNDLRGGGGRALAGALRLNNTLALLNLSDTGRGTAPQHHAHVAQPWRQCPGKGRRAGAGTSTAPQHHAHVA
jgi:hypothetical protein